MWNLTLQDIKKAREQIRTHVVRTPLVYNQKLSARLGAEVFLKCENLQHTGSFKIRGAINRFSYLTPEQKKKGIVACSAGNHAQGVALEAARLGIRAVICMPKTAPIVKVTNTRNFGVEVRLIGTTVDEAMAEARRLEKEEGLIYISPFADPMIVAGQGTVGDEIIEDIIPDYIFVPIGGGGLASGIGVAVSSHPSIKVIGIQSDRASAVTHAFRTGELLKTPVTATLADGLAVKSVSMDVVALLKKYLKDIRLVNEVEVIRAVGLILEEAKMVVEGGGAVGLAAALQMTSELKGKKVVIVLSGGNIDLSVMESIADQTLTSLGRLARLNLVVPNRPGMLNKITTIVANEGANVLQVFQERADANRELAFGMTHIRLELETSGFEQIDRITHNLSAEGFGVSKI